MPFFFILFLFFKQVVPFETNKGVEDDDQNINIGIEHVTSKIEDVTGYLRKIF